MRECAFTGFPDYLHVGIMTHEPLYCHWTKTPFDIVIVNILVDSLVLVLEVNFM